MVSADYSDPNFPVNIGGVSNVLILMWMLLPLFLAQSYATGFESGETSGWTFSNTSAVVGWAIDGTPTNAPGGAVLQGSASLNYNGSTDYSTGATPNGGSAFSPLVTLSGMTNPRLAFWCNYDTDTPGTATDRRRINVKDTAGTILATFSFATAGGDHQCVAMGYWHPHFLALNPAWGTIRIEFVFDTVDANNNGFKGWFIDNFQIGESVGQTLTTLLQNPFDGASPLAGWTLSATAAPAWAADGSPAGMPGGAFVSAPNSLNYNDGADYDPGVNSGTALSPAITLTGYSNISLVFMCNYQTDTTGVATDRRVITIRDAATLAVLDVHQVAETGGSAAARPCHPSGFWHSHVITLQPSWGSVRIEFSFDTVDGNSNAFAGWFIDDLRVISAPPPSNLNGSAGGGDEDDRTEITCVAAVPRPGGSGLVALLALLAAACRLRRLHASWR